MPPSIISHTPPIHEWKQFSVNLPHKEWYMYFCISPYVHIYGHIHKCHLQFSNCVLNIHTEKYWALNILESLENLQFSHGTHTPLASSLLHLRPGLHQKLKIFSCHLLIQNSQCSINPKWSLIFLKTGHDQGIIHILRLSYPTSSSSIWKITASLKARPVLQYITWLEPEDPSQSRSQCYVFTSLIAQSSNTIIKSLLFLFETYFPKSNINIKKKKIDTHRMRNRGSRCTCTLQITVWYKYSKIQFVIWLVSTFVLVFFLAYMCLFLMMNNNHAHQPDINWVGTVALNSLPNYLVALKQRRVIWLSQKHFFFPNNNFILNLQIWENGCYAEGPKTNHCFQE